MLDTNTGSPDSTSPSNANIGIIIGAVVAAVVVIVTVILIVGCLLYRQVLKRENTRDTGNIQNAAYEGDVKLNRALPQIPQTDSEYEEPAVYAQLDNSHRVPIDENYQSLNVEGYEQLQTDHNENIPQYASLNNSLGGGRIPVESMYEELP